MVCRRVRCYMGTSTRPGPVTVALMVLADRRFSTSTCSPTAASARALPREVTAKGTGPGGDNNMVTPGDGIRSFQQIGRDRYARIDGAPDHHACHVTDLGEDVPMAVIEYHRRRGHQVRGQDLAPGEGPPGDQAGAMNGQAGCHEQAPRTFAGAGNLK